MLSTRIITTLELCALEGLPLTLFEVHKFLLNEPLQIREVLGKQGEVVRDIPEAELEYVTLSEVQMVLHDLEQKQMVISQSGFYTVPKHTHIIKERIHNFAYGIVREKRIRRLLPWLRRIPFIKAIALAGSQALGQQKPTSDIDLLVITDKQFFWLARTLLTGFLHIAGVRRHGQKIANRFCLNHYLAEPKRIERRGNIYTALEYTKLRPLFGHETIRKFWQRNRKWIQNFFPHVAFVLYGKAPRQPSSSIKKIGELVFRNRFGAWLEQKLKAKLRARIRTEDDIVVMDNELLFHHDGRQYGLTRKFLELPALQTPRVIVEEIEIVDIVM